MNTFDPLNVRRDQSKSCLSLIAGPHIHYVRLAAKQDERNAALGWFICMLLALIGGFAALSFWFLALVPASLFAIQGLRARNRLARLDYGNPPLPAARQLK